jgi:hypothetical protein
MSVSIVDINVHKFRTFEVFIILNLGFNDTVQRTKVYIFNAFTGHNCDPKQTKKCFVQ